MAKGAAGSITKILAHSARTAAVPSASGETMRLPQADLRICDGADRIGIAVVIPRMPAIKVRDRASPIVVLSLSAASPNAPLAVLLCPIV